MIENITLLVTQHDLPARLDKFLCNQLPHLSRSLIVDAIESKDILLNGSPVLKGRNLKADDVVLIRRLLEEADIRVVPNPTIKLDIIHEDNDILIIDKPPGIPVHPIKADETGTLANGLVARYPELADVGDDPLFPAFVHRIDSDTSGIIVAAKNDNAYKNLRKQFQEKKIRKIYLALVEGDVAKGGKMDNYLFHDPKDQRRMKVAKSCHCEAAGGGRSNLTAERHSERSEESQRMSSPLRLLRHTAPRNDRLLRAVTRYIPLKRFGTRTLLEVEIKTGVMHQIRCHLADIGHPIAGDKIYRGTGKGVRGKDAGERHLLHAHSIGFAHPATGKQVRFEAELPADFKKCLTKSLESI